MTQDGSTNMLHPILAFNDTDLESSSDQGGYVGVARLCSHFQHLFNFTDHCKDVLHNLLSQLNILMSKDQSPVKLTPNKLSCIWTSVGKFLSMLMMLDTSLLDQKMQQSWLQYKRTIKSIRNEPEKYGGSIESVRNLEKILLKLENTVVSGNMFETVLGVKITVGKALCEELTNFLRTFSVEAEKDSSGEKYLILLSLTALARQVSGQYDRRLVTRCWDIVKKLPAAACVSQAMIILRISD